MVFGLEYLASQSSAIFSFNLLQQPNSGTLRLGSTGKPQLLTAVSVDIAVENSPVFTLGLPPMAYCASDCLLTHQVIMVSTIFKTIQT